MIKFVVFAVLLVTACGGSSPADNSGDSTPFSGDAMGDYRASVVWDSADDEIRESWCDGFFSDPGGLLDFLEEEIPKQFNVTTPDDKTPAAMMRLLSEECG